MFPVLHFVHVFHFFSFLSFFSLPCFNLLIRTTVSLTQFANHTRSISPWPSDTHHGFLVSTSALFFSVCNGYATSPLLDHKLQQATGNDDTVWNLESCEKSSFVNPRNPSFSPLGIYRREVQGTSLKTARGHRQYGKGRTLRRDLTSLESGTARRPESHTASKTPSSTNAHPGILSLQTHSKNWANVNMPSGRSTYSKRKLTRICVRKTSGSMPLPQ